MFHDHSGKSKIHPATSPYLKSLQVRVTASPLSALMASLETYGSSMKEINLVLCPLHSKEILVYFYKIIYCFICLNLNDNHPDSHLKIKTVLIFHSETANICNPYHISI